MGVRRTSVIVSGPREEVFAMFADRENYRQLVGPIGATLVSAGDDERQGPGAVHRVGVGRVGIREQITALEPGRSFSYRAVTPLPVRHWIGTVEFHDDPEGTRVEYTLDVDAVFPVPGPVIGLAVKGLGRRPRPRGDPTAAARRLTVVTVSAAGHCTPWHERDGNGYGRAMLTISAAARTHVGHVRKSNEDSMLVTDRFVAVADGLGGHAAGEVASQVAVDRLEQLDAREYVHPDDVVAAIADANRLIVEQMRAHPENEGMGTTVSGLGIVDVGSTQHCVVFNVGDSRVYRYADDALSQVTVDHSEVEELVAAGGHHRRGGDAPSAPQRRHPLPGQHPRPVAGSVGLPAGGRGALRRLLRRADQRALGRRHRHRAARARRPRRGRRGPGGAGARGWRAGQHRRYRRGPDQRRHPVDQHRHRAADPVGPAVDLRRTED